MKMIKNCDFLVHFLLRDYVMRRHHQVFTPLTSATVVAAKKQQATETESTAPHVPTQSIFLDFIAVGWQIYSLLVKQHDLNQVSNFLVEATPNILLQIWFRTWRRELSCKYWRVFRLLFFQINDIFVLFLSHRLVFGTLYPAYSSYKAIKTKNVREYVRNIDFVPCLAHTSPYFILC